MDYSSYQRYSLPRLYRVLDTLTEAEHPVLRPRIEARIRELESKQPRLEGIGGWLMPVAGWLVITPFRLSRILYGSYFGLFSDGSWHTLSTPGNAGYDPGAAHFLASELGLLLCLLAADLLLAFLFFTRRRSFPRWFIGISAASLLLLAADVWIVRPWFPQLPPLSPVIMRELGYDLVRCLAGIPYMLMSRRVRQTFTH